MLFCLNRRRGVFTAKVGLACRAVLFLFSGRCASGAVHKFFVDSCYYVALAASLFCNSCHHVLRLCTLSLWTPVSISRRSSRPEVRRPASGWGSLWESSSFVPCLILNTFREVSGVVPEWPWSSGFMRKSSSLASAPSVRFSVLLNSCDIFGDSSLNFLGNLCYIVLLWSGNIWVWCQITSDMFLTVFLIQSCQFFFVVGCHSIEKRFRRLTFDCLFYCKIKWKVYSISVRK